MPPKQQSKANLAKKQKIVEDKTFGLKNKNKCKNVQKYVQTLKQSVQPKPDPSKISAKVPLLSYLFFFFFFEFHLFTIPRTLRLVSVKKLLKMVLSYCRLSSFKIQASTKLQ
jgi:hypothetical protein